MPERAAAREKLEKRSRQRSYKERGITDIPLVLQPGAGSVMAICEPSRKGTQEKKSFEWKTNSVSDMLSLGCRLFTRGLTGGKRDVRRDA